ncbi:hypothetical protein P3T26_004918 [Streptomyces sp. MAA16]|nr:hypothetical protein [Streptomyces sp. MAA16]
MGVLVQRSDKQQWQARFRKLRQAALYSFVRGSASAAGAAVVSGLVWIIRSR